MNRPIAVLGAGNSGLAMAAHLTFGGYQVRLWNRWPDMIESLLQNATISVNGIIKGQAQLSFVSSSISEVLDGVSVVMVTTPANAHPDIAQLMAPYVSTEMMIFLNPGRTFGALEFSSALQKNGCTKEPLVIETQTIIYTCRKTAPDEVNIIALKKDVLFSTLDSGLNCEILKKIPFCLQPYFKPARSILETSIGNIGMILHCAPVLLNCGWIESKHTQFKYYYEGITPSVARLLEKLDKERLEVASLLGCSIESTSDWLRRTYGVRGIDLYECIQNNPAYRSIDAPESLKHRYILEDVNCGLVPLESVGNDLGLPMRICGQIIDLAELLMDESFRKSGRIVDIDRLLTKL